MGDGTAGEGDMPGMSEQEHELKCWPEFFEQIVNGSKTFELRKDDRQPPFRVGNTLWLREWRRLTFNPLTGGYTGREVRVRVTYVLSGFGLEKDYVCMGFEPAAVASLRALLREYGRHQEGCSAVYSVPGGAQYRCRCGWDVEMAKVGS